MQNQSTLRNKLIVVTCFLIFIFLLDGCKGNQNQQETTPIVISKEEPNENRETIDIDELSELLKQASTTLEIDKFRKFLEQMERLEPAKQEQFLLGDGQNVHLVYEIEGKLFNQSLHDSLFYLHSIIRNVIQNNSEYMAMIDKRFANFFLNNLAWSINTLNNISSISVRRSIINSIVFKEGAANEIVRYMEKNELDDTSLYKEFLQYKI